MFLLSNFSSSLPSLHAAEFDALVVPSLMESDMDGWYKIPQNSRPSIPVAYSIFHGQSFRLVVLFRGYTAGKDDNVHIRYDVQIYDPQGKQTNDKGSNLLAYQGPNPKVFILSQEYLAIKFPEKYPPGTYKIKVTGYDKIANKSFTAETSIDLLQFALPEKFASMEKAGEWMMGYHKNPTPIKAISALQSIVQLDPKWQKRYVPVSTCLGRVFSDNPFLLKNIAKQFDSFSVTDQKRFLLVCAVSNNTILEPVIAGDGKEELREFYNKAKKIKIPDTNGEINTALQLDILWSEFFATGKYAPIRKIVGALALIKHEKTLEKIRSGEIKTLTEEAKLRVYYLVATHGSAAWSLASNCTQIPLVYKYCVSIYEREDLDESIKNQLGAILIAVQEKIREKEKSGKLKKE